MAFAEIDPTNYNSKLWYSRGGGDGRFGAATMLWSGRYLSGIALVDLDDDGVLDVIMHHYENGFWRGVARGLGNGTFAAPTQTAMSALVSRLAVRDVNADGRPDVVGQQGDGVVVALGQADGTLAPLVHTPTPSLTAHSAFADLDGDGRLDLVSATGGLVVVLLGRGDGAFRAPIYYQAREASDWGSPTISTGDVDRDGRVDILINNSYDRVSVLPGRCLSSP